MNYATHATDIVGYSYAADIYCPGDMRTTAAFALAAPGEAAFMGRPSDGDDTEGFLARWAESLGVNRTDESSYDSSDFPKVIFASQVESDEERCGTCGASLIGD